MAVGAFGLASPAWRLTTTHVTSTVGGHECTAASVSVARTAIIDSVPILERPKEELWG